MLCVFGLKPDRMLAYKISTDEVMEALSSQSLETSPGKREASGKRSQAFEYVLKYSGRLQPKTYANIILRSNPNGEKS
jgi:HAE1 family hydrophobic/amphiphilic exporter-1